MRRRLEDPLRSLLTGYRWPSAQAWRSRDDKTGLEFRSRERKLTIEGWKLRVEEANRRIASFQGWMLVTDVLNVCQLPFFCSALI
jgi:hypothetical protein